MLTVAGSALVLVMAIAWWRGSQEPQAQPQPKADVRLKEAADSMNCSEKELQSWVNSAQGKPAETPLDDRTLDRLSKHNGVARFFVADLPVDELSQFHEVIKLLNPETATESTNVRVALDKAHSHLVRLRESAAAVSGCADWRPRLQSTEDPDLSPLPDNHVTFIESLVKFGTEQLIPLVPKPEIADPIFRENDDRRFRNLTKFFTSDRQAPIRKVLGRDTYTIRKDGEAFLEATEKMPLDATERTQLRDIGERAAGRSKCSEIDELVKHYVAMCKALGQMPRAKKDR